MEASDEGSKRKYLQLLIERHKMGCIFITLKDASLSFLSPHLLRWCYAIVADDGGDGAGLGCWASRKALSIRSSLYM